MSRDPIICSYAEVVSFIEGYIRRAESLESLIDDIDQGVLEKEIKIEVELETASNELLLAIERLKELSSLADDRQALVLKTFNLQKEYFAKFKEMDAVVNSVVQDVIDDRNAKLETDVAHTKICENPECKKAFVPSTPTAKYCSMKCSSRVRYLRMKTAR